MKHNILVVGLVMMLLLAISGAQAEEVVITMVHRYTASSIGDFNRPSEGNQYLIFDLTIANNGYKNGFHVNPNDLKVSVNKIRYNYDWATPSIKDPGYPPMTDCVVEDGGVLPASIAFEVPRSSSGNFQYSVSWEEFLSSHNVRFVFP
jgi:hypothetical protein